MSSNSVQPSTNAVDVVDTRDIRTSTATRVSTTTTTTTVAPTQPPAPSPVIPPALSPSQPSTRNLPSLTSQPLIGPTSTDLNVITSNRNVDNVSSSRRATSLTTDDMSNSRTLAETTSSKRSSSATSTLITGFNSTVSDSNTYSDLPTTPFIIAASTTISLIIIYIATRLFLNRQKKSKDDSTANKVAAAGVNWNPTLSHSRSLNYTNNRSHPLSNTTLSSSSSASTLAPSAPSHTTTTTSGTPMKQNSCSSKTSLPPLTSLRVRSDQEIAETLAHIPIVSNTTSFSSLPYYPHVHHIPSQYIYPPITSSQIHMPAAISSRNNTIDMRDSSHLYYADSIAFDHSEAYATCHSDAARYSNSLHHSQSHMSLSSYSTGHAEGANSMGSIQNDVTLTGGMDDMNGVRYPYNSRNRSITRSEKYNSNITRIARAAYTCNNHLGRVDVRIGDKLWVESQEKGWVYGWNVSLGMGPGMFPDYVLDEKTTKCEQKGAGTQCNNAGTQIAVHPDVLNLSLKLLGVCDWGQTGFDRSRWSGYDIEVYDDDENGVEMKRSASLDDDRSRVLL